MKNLFFLGLVAIALTGCALPVKYKTPGSRFDLPETQGAFGRGEVAADVGSRQEVVLTHYANSIPPNTRAPAIEHSWPEMNGSARLGLLRFLDVAVKNLWWDSSSLLQLKAQFLGKPLSEAEEGNFSAAIALGGGVSSRAESQSDYRLFGPAATQVDRAEMRTRTVDAGLALGYRPGPRFLVFGGPFFSHTAYSGSADGGSDYAPVTFEGESHQWGSTLGLHYGQPSGDGKVTVFARTELGFVHVESGDTLYDGGLFGVQVGLQF